MKIKLDKADIVYSKWLRKFRGYKCERCGKFYEDGKGLMVCHFWSRRHEGTRFEPDNTLIMDFGCHQRMDADKHGEFRDFMLKRLGEQRFKTLQIQVNTYKKRDRQMAYMIFKKLLEELK